MVIFKSFGGRGGKGVRGQHNKYMCFFLHKKGAEIILLAVGEAFLFYLTFFGALEVL